MDEERIHIVTIARIRQCFHAVRPKGGGLPRPWTRCEDLDAVSAVRPRLLDALPRIPSERKMNAYPGSDRSPPRRLTVVSFAIMLARMDGDTATESPQGPVSQDAPVQDCPQCGFPMNAVRGSKDAVCTNCGFKDSCCY